MTQKHLFCFGLGYSATLFAKQLLTAGWRVSGTCRTAEKCESMRRIGITSYIFDEGLPLGEIWDLQTVTHILHSIPPSELGDGVMLNHLDDLQKLSNLQWLGYLSTTGVYGNYNGEWVDEESPLKATNARSIRRVNAEKAWLASSLPVHIFRLSGIYGKGRSVIDELNAGTAHMIYKEGQVFSRINVEDIAQILQASINSPNIGRIYNCADDLPAPQHEVVAYAASLLGTIAPKMVDFANANLSPMAQSFWQSNRRIQNLRIKNELKVALKYPTYKQGLQAC